ncbi:MAG: hypothetical protein ACI8WB_003663 [Phenylobacterium sp.]|jgi:hypothetical protein
MQIKETDTELRVTTVIIGLMVIAAGIFCLFFAFGKDYGNPFANIVLFWFGVILVGNGIPAAVFVEAFDFDTSAGQVRHSKGLIVPLSTKVYPFGSIQSIEGRMHSGFAITDRYGNVTHQTYNYSGYLVFDRSSVKVGWSLDKAEFKVCMDSISRATGVGLSMDLETVTVGGPKDKRVNILRILLMLSTVAAVSAGLFFYVWG